MSETTQIVEATGLSAEVLALLPAVPILASLEADQLHCLDGARELRVAAGDVLVRQGETTRSFWILLQGSLRGSQEAANFANLPVYTIASGSTFGEVPLLAKVPVPLSLTALEECLLLELDEDQFWGLLTSCPGVRKAILGNMAQRLQKMQSMTLQQEKMASLGTMAAGLMHELNNPGSAAKRAASQLRANLTRMHELGAKFSTRAITEEQKTCLYELQTQALACIRPQRMNSVDQMDAEERLVAWMEDAQVEDAWKLAPALVGAGIDEEHLACARGSFTDGRFSDALSWVEAMVSSQQLVSTIEESITRVSELVKAVKSYAYEGKGKSQLVDINDSIHATMVILAHKMRAKEIALEKSFGAGMPKMQTAFSGLNQVWTNLLDNAIDAVGQGGRVAVHTWHEVLDGRTELCVSVRDDGAGIPLESQPQVFEEFYTTKPVGVGTGLGLGIVHRIVEQYGGTIRFSSEPGNTEFMVRLPAERL